MSLCYHNLSTLVDSDTIRYLEILNTASGSGEALHYGDKERASFDMLPLYSDMQQMLSYSGRLITEFILVTFLLCTFDVRHIVKFTGYDGSSHS